MFKGAAIARLVLLGTDLFLNRGQVTDGALAMLKQIARAFGF